VKATSRLPLVDPDFRISEGRSEILHAYARGLLEHLRAIRAGGRAEGYPITTIKVATAWLIDAYAEAGVAPAPEAAQLVREIIGPNSDTSTLPVQRLSEAAYWAAIDFEAHHPPDPAGKQPSSATRYAVAKHILGKLKTKNASQRSAEATIRGWQKLPHYKANVKLQRPASLRVKT